MRVPPTLLRQTIPLTAASLLKVATVKSAVRGIRNLYPHVKHEIVSAGIFGNCAVIFILAEGGDLCQTEIFPLGDGGPLRS